MANTLHVLISFRVVACAVIYTYRNKDVKSMRKKTARTWFVYLIEIHLKCNSEFTLIIKKNSEK